MREGGVPTPQDAAGLVKPDFQEQGEVLPYRGRNIVVVGGSDGTGLTAAIEFKRLGARVAIGTSQENHIPRALVNFRRAKVDPEGILPFVADVSNPFQVARAVKRLKQDGMEDPDVVNAAATGMPFAQEFINDFLVPMNRKLTEDPEHAKGFIDEKTAELNRRLDVLLPESEAEAIAVNHTGQVALVEAFGETFDRFSFLTINSTFGYEGVGPRFYGNVLTKRLFSTWLDQNGPRFAAEGRDTAEIVLPVIEGTSVGNSLLQRVVPLWAASEDENIRRAAVEIVRTKITRADAVSVIREFLDMTPQERSLNPRPCRLFGYGDNGQLMIAQRMPQHLKMQGVQFPF